MCKFYIDINADLGEGVGNDAQLMPLLSSCSIACGGHAGDEVSMRKTIKLAVQHQVKIGVHPSYPDTENFGRVSIKISATALIESIQKQISFFCLIAAQEKAVIHHIKPHGALYNDIAKDIDLAQVFLRAIAPYKNKLKVYVPYASAIEKEALNAGFTIFYEAFLDRNYNTDLSLVSRLKPNAMIEKPFEVLNHLIAIVKHQKVSVITGEMITLKAETFCIHSDTDASFEILTYLHSQFFNHQISLKKSEKISHFYPTLWCACCFNRMA